MGREGKRKRTDAFIFQGMWNVNVFCSALDKLRKLCKMSVPASRPREGCLDSDEHKFRDCVYYKLPVALVMWKNLHWKRGPRVNNVLRVFVERLIVQSNAGSLPAVARVRGCRPKFPDCNNSAKS